MKYPVAIERLDNPELISDGDIDPKELYLLDSPLATDQGLKLKTDETVKPSKREKNELR